MRFWYRYNPFNTENFIVRVVMKDAAGNEIARAEKLDGAEALEWTSCEIPIVYSNLTTRAASIYISFTSAGSGAGVHAAWQMEIAGKQQTAHIGSVLRIDDVELVY